ncbi:hypothetical protein lerEdw1_019119 [Lerista edwardsae]|nr:hypothetical protein lerEdw1_019119 [Lerista edwardsae]
MQYYAKSEETTKLEKENSALNKVLELLCSYHWHQILAMLKFLFQDPCIPSLCNCQLPQVIYSETAEDCMHFPVCSCDGYTSVKRCCLQNQRPNSCLSPLSVYVKDMDSLSCQSVAAGYLNTVVNKGIAVPCSLHRCSPKQLQQCKIHSAGAALCTHLFSAGQKINKAGRGRSPSPPPLSPVEAEENDSLEESLALDNRLQMNTNQPPSLLPAEKNCSVCDYKDKICIAEAPGNLDETFLHANQENSLINSDKLEKAENAAAFQNLMDRINEKLKSIETTDIAALAKLSKSDGRTETNIKLRSFVTSLLNNAKVNDYNIMELLSQHNKEVENKIIQTRFRKRQETLLAMHNSPDSSLFRRQSLQIKRELANLDETFVRKKASSERNTKKLMKNDKLSPNKTDNQSTLKDLTLQYHEKKEKQFSPIESKSLPICQEELPLNNLESNSCFVALSENNSTSPQTNLARMHGNCGVGLYMDQVPVKRDDERMLDRTKCYIPPMWCSVYVKKILFQKSSKARNPSNCMERERDKIQAKTCSNEDINKVVRNTNLHVVVERLEDTINMAQKTNKPLFKGYKISSKLKELHKCDANNNSKNGLLISMSENGSNGPCVLSQSHPLYNNNSKKDLVSMEEDEASDEEYKSLLKPSTFDSTRLTSSNENLQTISDAGDSSPVPNYTSPIKLMFLSEINSSEGVKYTLTSVNDSSKLNIDLYSIQDKTNVLSEKQLEARDLNKNIALEECGYGDSENSNIEVNSAFPAIIVNETNIGEHKPNEEPIEQSGSGPSLKRKPGRPKKIGPQVVKQVKRPIGRPPKPKVDLAENANCPSDSIGSGKSANFIADVLEEDSINKNITVTVVFGRSRRTKRCVSEGSLNVIGLVPSSHSDCGVLHESAQVKQNLVTRNSLPKNTAMQNSTTENKPSAAGYEHIRLLESSPVLPSHCSNIVRPNQKPLNVIRKPGRPAKVKISGISVTVNQISSQERKVSISSCLPPLEQATVLEKNASPRKDDKQCNKGEDTQSFQNDRSVECSDQKITMASKKPALPLRQSVRDRRPSLPFLHSLASSSSLPCRSAFLHKSYKLHLKNAKEKKIRHHSAMSPSVNENSENAKKRPENNLFRVVNEMPLDPILSSRPSLRWWDPSISNDSLLKELNNRYEQITNTWLHVNGDEFEKCLYDEDCHIEQDCSIKVSNPLDSCIFKLENSPIKMLFQKKCDINELCTWFMQTTETQSLSLVRKANARNPFEVINTRQFKMGTRQSDCSNSPFRKHFKKFALSAPSKSVGKLQILHKIVRSQVLKKKRNFTLAKYKRTKFENLQWRQVKKLYNHGTCDWKSKNLRFICQSQHFANASRNINNKLRILQGNDMVEPQSPTILVESHKITSLTGTEIGDAIFHQNTQLSDISTQSVHCNQKNILKAQSSGKFGEGAWSDQNFKDCRIFLKKINPIEEQHSFNENAIICTPGSVDLCTSSRCFQEKRHCTLRSHSAKQNVSEKGGKDSEASRGTKPPSVVKGLHIEQDSKKSSKRVTFDDGPTEVPKKMNKRRRSQCKSADMNIRKRNKRRLCSAGQVSSCYSKYQLG